VATAQGAAAHHVAMVSAAAFYHAAFQHSVLRAVVFFVTTTGPFGPSPASGNWLLQCSTCVDQSYFSDYQLKDNIKDADLKTLYAQLRQVRLREFDHKQDEFYNKFFSKRQLGIVAQEVQSIMPNAVANLPERRWNTMKGQSNSTKNVMMIRDSHFLFAVIASMQVLANKAEFWDTTIEKMVKDLADVVKEQNHNRVKREDMLEQIVRIVAKVEVIQNILAKTEEGFVRLDSDIHLFKGKQEANHAELVEGLGDVRNRTLAQDDVIAAFKEEFRWAVEREARADLIEKRRASESDLEVALVKRSIEKLRWDEEQKTIKMREEESRRSEDHSSKLHQERVERELTLKKASDLELMQKQEESNMRQEAARVAGEKELLKLKLESEEKRAEIDVQKAIETAKIENEAKIRERRENEDVHLRLQNAEWQEKKNQMLAAIRESAAIAQSWVHSIFSSPQNLFLAIGSVVACMGGVYIMRELAILLREQLNKRLGRPSLVRQTNRRGLLKQLGIAILRFLRLRAPHGAEFSDVVLHPRLHAQVMRLADATRSAKMRGMPLMHVMFYGPPGTGKTMVAQRFAEYSGLEYAIMSGGDVAPLEDQAVTELHKLFKWVHRSKRGVLLFIDEADAFLSSRKKGTMSEPLRNALTTMLYHTGTPSSKFTMVLATNRPHDLDAAVLDRIDESVEFGLPDFGARQAMMELYFDMYIAKPLHITALRPEDLANGKEKAVASSRCKSCTSRLRRTAPAPPPHVARDTLVDQNSLVEAARRLHGFSGREIAKLMNALQTHILYSDRSLSTRKSGAHFLQRTMLFDVVDQKVVEHQRTAEFQVTGYNYENTEKPAPEANGDGKSHGKCNGVA